MSGITAETVTEMLTQIKASQESLLQHVNEHKTYVDKALTLIQSLFASKEVNVIQVKDPLEEIKKVKEQFDAECELYNTPENRHVYESNNLKVELLYPDKKIKFLNLIIDILCLYKDAKISTVFKEIFLSIFKYSVPLNKNYEFEGTTITKQVYTLSNLAKDKLKSILHFQNHMSQEEIDEIKEKILKVRDIRWLLLEMEKYPKFFNFTEDDLELMKEYKASRDNIYLVKKILKKDGDYEEYYSEEDFSTKNTKDFGVKLKYQMKDGNLHGEYKEFYPSGKLKSETSYTKGEQDNEWKVWYENGQQFVEGKINGENIQWYPSGKIMNKYIRINNKKEGEYKEWHENGNLWLIANHKDDKLYGNCEFYLSNGSLQVKMFCLDGNIKKDLSYYKLHGEYKEWNSNGILVKECTYNNGILHGEYKEYRDDRSVLKECFYKEGKLDGEYKVYDSNGKLSYNCYYKEDKLEGECINWFPNGKLSCHCYYKEGQLEGEFKGWHFNVEGEILREQKYYKNGKLEGEYKEWNANGKLWIHKYYKDNLLHGELKSWDENGNLFEQKYYKDGNIDRIIFRRI